MSSIQTVSLESTVSLLEQLASSPPTTTAGLHTDDQLRKRFLLAIQKLVPELETPAEACQRVLYNGLELPVARIAVDLNIFNSLKESPTPLSTDELAKLSGKSPDTKLLARVLRYLASLSLVREVDTGVWTASRFGNNLSGEGQSAGVASMVDNCFVSMVTLPAFLRRHGYNPPDTKSDTAFALGNRVSPEEATFFDWLKTRPENAKEFNVFMGSHRTGVKTWLDRPEVITEITDAFKKVTAGKDERKGVSFVDIGGGIGHQCKAFKKRVPELKGKIVLEDLEEVVATAELEDGIEKLGIDFLEGQPVKGAASYYFRSVLRNWPDRYSRTVMGYVRDAMDDNSLLLIDELVLPDRGAHRYETQLDLTMLAMLNAEARTEAHWKELLGEVGLEVKQIIFYEEEAREAVIIAKKVSS
ncbi:S-adenosyl-L-methionine-dependent methyltransferase [Hypoxylon trugodes]|uniref:S-adenosyl-L-methionine-dependent methyltransferase n=1 Tax=Hypoxylon trugodes TaxID=326681 RepID=UPI00219E15EE|nr:S-adenosyl-L-methionine-dependent methyltransferase [Hypoxylon trugodes]KAI1394294.1 S-adenosyl-L-methionine-dependent methyltransferase [Hypoxylon trugodes]